MATLIERQAAELEALIRACAMAGKSPKEIAEQTGLSRSTILNRAKEYGLKISYTRTRLPALPEQTQKMLEMEIAAVASRYSLTTKQAVSLMMRRLHQKPKAAQQAQQQAA